MLIIKKTKNKSMTAVAGTFKTKKKLKHKTLTSTIDAHKNPSY